MTDPSRRQQSTTPVVPIVMGLVFGGLLLVLVLNGGMCERYTKKMERQRQMRDYLESQRRR